ncbi:hypothetical protein Tco_0078230 [Tanacetum coccineum]
MPVGNSATHFCSETARYAAMSPNLMTRRFHWDLGLDTYLDAHRIGGPGVDVFLLSLNDSLIKSRTTDIASLVHRIFKSVTPSEMSSADALSYGASITSSHWDSVPDSRGWFTHVQQHHTVRERNTQTYMVEHELQLL